MSARHRLLPALLLLAAACGHVELTPEPDSIEPVGNFESAWSTTPDRVWIGPEYWANRLQDWSVFQGRVHCASTLPWRSLHLLTRRIEGSGGRLEASVRLGFVPFGGQDDLPAGASAGLLLGAGAADLDHRSACLVQSAPGPDGGLFAGVDASGHLLLHRFGEQAVPEALAGGDLLPPELLSDMILRVSSEDGQSVLLSVHDPHDGLEVASTAVRVDDPHELIGNVALLANPVSGRRLARFWFSDWRLEGDMLDVRDDRSLGSILSAQHTLSRGVMKMTAQLMPIAATDSHAVVLQVMKDEEWASIATSQVIEPGYTATFRIENWPASRDVRYRLVHYSKRSTDDLETFTWSGTVRRDPVGKDSIVLAAFTGNHNCKHGFGRAGYPWNENALWFPHADLVERVARHDPDLLFFSGDQVYEGASPTRAEKRDRPELDYLYKWYLWCWAFRDLTRSVPCVAIPDDHDVYQGNIWGQGGRATKVDNQGGYVMPADWVRMVERTQTSNLPDPAHAEPIEQGITTYYTSLLVGGIDFAVLEDRKFKSGCAGLVSHGGPRPDHITDPELDPKIADVPGAKLLGDRQLEFLRDWAVDWNGVRMKAALSQTVFANVATLHGGNLQRLVADLDSNGWPQSGRNRALAALRIGSAFMVGGDQHLATIVHHGIDTWDDAGWSFCVPSVANFYPRAWAPLEPGQNREEGSPEFTGRHLDGFGNHVTVYAATNPTPQGRKPAALHDSMPGYGIVRFAKPTGEITMECWPRYADPATDAPYPGWPRTIHWLENDGREPTAFLPTLRLRELTDVVVQVLDEKTGEPVWARRMQGPELRLGVYHAGTYSVLVGEPETGRWKRLPQLLAVPGNSSVVEVDL